MVWDSNKQNLVPENWYNQNDIGTKIKHSHRYRSRYKLMMRLQIFGYRLLLISGRNSYEMGRSVTTR